MKKSTILLTAIMLFMTSCATLFSGTKQTVQINSMPSGAKIQVDGIDRGKTPLAIKLNKGVDGQVVTLIADGYETKSFQLQTDFNAIAILNFLNFLAWYIDSATGAMWKYGTTFFNIELEPKKEENK